MKKTSLIVFAILIFHLCVFSQGSSAAKNYLDSLFHKIELEGDLIAFNHKNMAYLRNMDKDILLQKVASEYRHTKNRKVLSYCIWLMREILYDRTTPKINQGIVEAVLQGNPYWGSTASLKGSYLLLDLDILPQDLNQTSLEILDKRIERQIKEVRERQKYYEKWKWHPNFQFLEEDYYREPSILAFHYAALTGKREYIDTIRLFIKDTLSCDQLFEIKHQNYKNWDFIQGYTRLSRLGDTKATNLLIECFQSSWSQQEWPIQNRTGIISSLLFTRNQKILQELLIPLLFNEEKVLEGELVRTKGDVILDLVAKSTDIPFFTEKGIKVYSVSDDFKTWLKQNAHTITFK